jgi:glucokinase
MQQSFLVGIDVGGTRLRLIAQNAGGATRSEPVEVPVPRSVDAMVDAIETLARTVVEEARIVSTAIGLPGQVLGSRCVWVPNLRFLDGVALGELVADRLGAPCQLINDAQATLVAEAAEGAARGFDDVVLIAVGTGIGGAYQVGGRLVRGANGCAGAFGWLPFSGSRRDADHGQWEQAGSGRSLERLALPWGTTEALLAAARRGDATARAVIDGYAEVLGEGVAALASVLDPDIIVFGGGLVSAFDLLNRPMLAAVTAHGSPAGGRVRLSPAALGGSAGVIGALRWAAEWRPQAPPEPVGEKGGGR